MLLVQNGAAIVVEKHVSSQWFLQFVAVCILYDLLDLLFFLALRRLGVRPCVREVFAR